ncbi:hypothetical protein [Larkinella soli]|uniref:hypothetical protein n=1 Tax=Larkinella soli TaxID=1770527 RepID=UPI000FFBFD2B|nr:hypothetical protein [Larkinella soli]
MRILLPILALWGLLEGCTTGKTALRHGRFDDAVLQSVQRLRQKPTHLEARTVLKTAYEGASRAHQTRIQSLIRTDDPYRWELVFQEYGRLQSLNDRVRTCPACAELLADFPLSLQDRMQEVRQLAAAARYQLAQQAFEFRTSNRLAARDAYQDFRKAEEWVPGYRDARPKADEAFRYATLRVVIEPLELTAVLRPDDRIDLQRLIFREVLRRESPSHFVRFLDRTMAEEDDLPANHLIQMAVTDYDPYDESTSSSSTSVESSQAYKVGTKKINDSTTVDVYEKVKGTLTTYRREVRSGLKLRIRAVDLQSDKVVWDDALWATESWTDEWHSFSGDERALNGMSLKTTAGFTPSTWSLLDKMMSSMAGSVGSRLRKEYRSY